MPKVLRGARGAKGVVRIPFGKQTKNEPIRLCVVNTAEQCGISPFLVAIVMSHFFEEMAERVCENKLVQVNGFGVFGPKAWVPRKPGLVPYCYPAFSAQRCFRNEVIARVPPVEPALDGINHHRVRNHPTTDRQPLKCSSTVLGSMRQFRSSIILQARQAGMDVYSGVVRDEESPR